MCHPTSDPTPPPTPAKDPDHPLDGEIFLWYNTFESENKYVSFGYTAAPPSMPAGNVSAVWLRAVYSDGDMPIQMHAVQGKKNVYALKSMFGDGEYDHYLRFVPQISGGDYLFMQASGERGGAAEVEFVLDASKNADTYDTYRMIDTNTSTYISYCTGGCDDG
jgi:hypothetical protein